jgi:hypothetical protein
MAWSGLAVLVAAVRAGSAAQATDLMTGQEMISDDFLIVILHGSFTHMPASVGSAMANLEVLHEWSQNNAQRCAHYLD